MKILYFLRVMKLLLLFLMAGLLHVSATTNAQSITLSGRNIPLQRALDAIRTQAGFEVAADKSLLRLVEPITIHANQMPIEEFVKAILRDQPIEARIEDKTVYLFERNNVNRDSEKVTTRPTLQHRVISGKVTDEQGNPLEGVTVTVKGANLGTSTDLEGTYQISVPEGKDIVIFSIVGFETVEFTVIGRYRVDLSLKAVVNDLDEAVVVGYGTAKRRDLTGAISSIKARELAGESPRTVQDLLRANAPGLIVNQANSAKGEAEIMLRGKGTLKAGTTPLNVVDGVIFDGTLADINPNDIESIDILKDASALAVYGAQAANGVIVITTKRGTGGKPRINYNGNIGFSENANMPRVMTGEEFLAYRYDYEVGRRSEAYHTQYPEMFVDPRKLSNVSQLDWFNYDQNPAVLRVDEEQLLKTWLARLELSSPEVTNYLAGRETDWQDLVFNSGFQNDHTISVSNKLDRVDYYWSINHIDRKGVVSGDRFKNVRSRLNLESTLTSFLRIGAHANFASRNEGFLAADWSQSAVITPYGSNNIDDLSSPYRRLPTGDAIAVNPFFDNMFRDRRDIANTLNASMYGILSLPFGIEFQSTYTPSYRWREFYNHNSTKNPEWASQGGSANRTFEKDFNWQIDNILRWNGNFSNHQISATLLQNAEKRQFWMTSASATDFSPSDILGWHRIQAGAVPVVSSNDTYRTADALMARIFYSYNSRYMLTASIRRDGYSAFGTENPWATFPALAFAWNFSDESLFRRMDWLEYGKIRLSWGRNGNREIGQYEALADMVSGLHPYIDQNGNVYLYSQLYVSRMANTGLKWENKASYNLGLDFAVFHGRLSGSIDAYKSATQNLLVDRALPIITGFHNVAANLGELLNSGMEVAINGDIVRGSSWNWKVSGMLSMNRRKLTKLYGDLIDVLDEEGNVIGQREKDDIQNRWFIGQDPDRIWDYERVGVWQLGEEADAAAFGLAPGDFKYRDQNGDGVMTDEDRVFQQWRTPRYRWSFRSNLSYRDIDLSFLIYANWGQVDTYNRAANSANFADRATDYATPRWTADNPINDYARIGSRNIGSNYVNRSFIRMDNIMLGYRVPVSVIKSMHIQNLTVAASIRNVFSWAPHWDFGDAESGGSPTPRFFNLNINLSI